MGQGLSLTANDDHDFFRSVQLGELQLVEKAIHTDPSILHRTTTVDGLSPLHIAAANGRIEVLSMILEKGVHPDLLNRQKQSPLMLAAIHGQAACVQRLIQAGANILMFDELHGRTCLHHAAYYGHLDCLKVILSAAHLTPVSDTWGFTRFVNVRDGNGATPLHLAARQRWPECAKMLLDNGALVSASTGNYICPGSTPLHLAARGGSLDCVRVLLARGADRLQRDSSGRTPYAIACKQNHMKCARLLNPTSVELLVWPSLLKFIDDLNPETKALLERALVEANIEREKNAVEKEQHLTASPTLLTDYTCGNSSEDDDTKLCCICFERPCTIEVQNCGHQMCASCTLILCCCCKPDPATMLPPSPVCPFCRSTIVQLVATEARPISSSMPFKQDELKISQCLSEGTSSLKTLASPMGFLGILGLASGRISASSNAIDKPS